MQKRIHTQGELFDELRKLPDEDRDHLMLARYDGGIFLETILEKEHDYGLAIRDYSNRQLVIAFGMLKDGASMEETLRKIRTEY
ncbi:hypothetical protein LGV61_01870 [Desulfurispirillum indicum]|uniref:hypothetical protein n=1 Tax=Desulfurispirillum indicum TaxID=936456 RepID=UPI001CF9B55C|nr:hypothetical protein [Desulfurispirillum indicum]UCZ57048.1 hypothetical protein LGV61_01870 [Desulfurispirillum indicum]